VSKFQGVKVSKSKSVKVTLTPDLLEKIEELRSRERPIPPLATFIRRLLSEKVSELLGEKVTSIPSEKVQKSESVKASKYQSEKVPKEWEYEPATEKQVNYLKDLIKRVAKVLNKTEDEVIREYDVDFENMTKKDASYLIDLFTEMLKGEEQAQKE